MLIKGLIDEDFVNYKKPSMFIITPYCDFKCEKECGIDGICQNSSLSKINPIKVIIDDIIQRYLNNNITKAVVIGGMEPFLVSEEIDEFIKKFREVSKDDIVIYTGYNEQEVKDRFNFIYNYDNIIIKFGRFIPNQDSHFDEILGVNLASPNQYAKKI